MKIVKPWQFRAIAMYDGLIFFFHKAFIKTTLHCIKQNPSFPCIKTKEPKMVGKMLLLRINVSIFFIEFSLIIVLLLLLF